MPQPYRDACSFLKALAEMAEELRQAIVPMSEAERTALLEQLLADSEMIFGVWPDPDSPDGIGIQIIRGEEVFPPLIGFEIEREIAIAALPCVSHEQALAARAAWGNQRPGRNHSADKPTLDSPQPVFVRRPETVQL